MVIERDFEGRKLKIEVGEMAKQANGSALVQYGETVVLATATCSKRERDMNFFPLFVDYEEKMYAAGKMPGGFIKREGRPSEKAILCARLIDRPIRPLFPDGMRNEVQVVCVVLSADQENDHDMPAMLAASIALSISGIPFDGPIAGVRVALIGDEYVINPTFQQLVDAKLSLIIAGTRENVMMIEASASEVGEEEVLKAIEVGQEKIKEIVDIILEIKEKLGKPTIKVNLLKADPELEKFMIEKLQDKVAVAMRTIDKQERNEAIDRLKDDAIEILEGTEIEDKDRLLEILKDEKSKHFGITMTKMEEIELQKMIVDENIRPDGRNSKEVRHISSRVSLLPRTHGSGLFTRGQTQVLTSVTLAPLSEGQTLDGLGIEDSKKYIHQYNFPPFSVGETKMMRGPGRREIGHGSLAERALLPMLPDEDEFPYAMRLVSEVLESNGSSSMASVCASSLALMDAGVPLKRPVAGIANGFIMKGENSVILTDIQGMEDHYGKMDFKVAGTTQGITALQMDIKVHGINRELLEKSLQQAKEARLFILDKMKETISEPRAELSPYAPRIFTMMIDPDKIRLVIGPGGKIVNKIIEETGVKIDIENDGSIYIASTDQEMGERARAMIQEIIREPEVGEIYQGKVVRITDFGAFIEFLPGKDGMIHISDLAVGRVNSVKDVLNFGDAITVQIAEIDSLGRINLKKPEVEKQRALLPKSDNPRGDSSRRNYRGKPPSRGPGRGR
ncbi:MAG: polyribonucleotide nucleotidyltransferase [Candidatus Eremiobacteraeota bacterium]|nr:polyribonucleotide nucleotidyltransferase [Candidatus Eremiobacteraeota bacterium]